MQRGEIQTLQQLANLPRGAWFKPLSVSNKQFCLSLFRKNYLERRLVEQGEGELQAFEYRALPSKLAEARQLGIIK